MKARSRKNGGRKDRSRGEERHKTKGIRQKIKGERQKIKDNPLAGGEKDKRQSAGWRRKRQKIKGGKDKILKDKRLKWGVGGEGVVRQ